MDQRQAIDWRDGQVPVSRLFDDPFYSLDDGLAETQHVFLAGNDLAARFAPGFHIAELGFGTGLNLAAAWMAWVEAGIDGPLHFTSFEAFPLPPADAARALSAYPSLAEIVPTVEAALAGIEGNRAQVETPSLMLELIIGDARQAVPAWTGAADAWFLDGFSPAKNPELWDADLMQKVGRRTRPGGSFATYTAAGDVRRALSAAGFTVERVLGFGRKRHMSVGRMA